MFDHWPSGDELFKLQFDENTRAMEQDDESDPICQCGNPAYVCCCNALAEQLGYWPDGSEYQST